MRPERDPQDIPLNFSVRASPQLLPEWMDGPCSYADFLACVKDIAATTRLTMAYAPTLQFLEHGQRLWPEGKPLHIVDVGSGGGDMLRRVARWGARRKLALRLTGIDLNPHATRAATELSASDPSASKIRWITGDVFEHPETQTPDLVLSSLVTHHMGEAEVVRFVRWMEQGARLGWFISDLVRSRRAYWLFGPLSRLMRWHRFVGHDGLVSIRRAFREEDWIGILQRAEVLQANVEIRRCAIGRLCVSRLRRAGNAGNAASVTSAPTEDGE